MSDHQHDHPSDHGHDHGEGHGHTHGIVDPSITTSERGLWAIKWSFVGLAITAALQLVVVAISGSVGLLADTIHNFGDAATAIPLGIAFWFGRKPPSAHFTFGYGRVEDFAGVAVVLTILVSALVAGYESIQRLLHPQEITHLWAVIGASILGFVGNEAVAVFRIRVGRESTAQLWSPTDTTPGSMVGPASPCSSVLWASGWATRWPIPSSGC